MDFSSPLVFNIILFKQLFTIQVKQMELNTRKQNEKQILLHKIESIFPLERNIPWCTRFTLQRT